MKHLTVDEIIDFVSLDKVDAKSLTKASYVNSHIRSCAQCLRKVRAFQTVYDELVRMGNRSAFREVARDMVKEELSQEDSLEYEE